MAENRKIKYENHKLTGLKLGKPKNKAAGLAAVTSAVQQMAKYMNPDDALRLSLKINQKGGFDCPGCAWPDPDDERSIIGEYCENGIKAIAEEATKRSLKADYFENNSISKISELSDFEIGKLGRLTEPMVLKSGSENYEPITWDDAFTLIGQKLNSLQSPDEAIFYTSGRTSNEAAYLYQLFVRSFGTNNLPDCSNMCHESSGVALSNTLGIGKGSVTLEDLFEAEVIMIMGQNPGTNHPRMLSALEKCKRNKGTIISVNPLREAGLVKFVDPQSPSDIITGGTELTDIYVPIPVGRDLAFIKAVIVRLFELDKLQGGGVIDRDFVQSHTSGFEELLKSIESVDYEECIRQVGIGKPLLEEVADIIARKQKIIICWAMGLTQHKNAVATIQEVVNLLLLKGSIGKPGAGTCPVRGHSNVQGDRTVGIWEKPPESFLKNLDDYHGITSPRREGYHAVSAIEAMHRGDAKIFIAMGGNFLSATPDTNYTAEALEKCDLTVHISTKLNRSHLVTGKEALILPCLGRTNKDIQASGPQFVSCENSMGVVQSSEGILDPPSPELKSEVSIVVGLAKNTLQNSEIEWDEFERNYDKIRDAIEVVVPGFNDYNERVREPGGFYLPNGARFRNWNTDTGKAKFTVNNLNHQDVTVGNYIMMTIRSHDQYNTTIYGLDDRYRGIYNERRVVLMNPEDIEDRGWSAKQKVNLYSDFNGIKREAREFLVVPYDIPRGNIATYFPEANVLVPVDSYAEKSFTPTSKWVEVSITEA